LNTGYGAAKGSLMVCALTHDDPATDCPRQRRTAALVMGGGILVGAIAVGLLMFGRYRRRRAAGSALP
jgi:hypothetical protein